MQVPTLVVASDQGILDVVEVELPGGVDDAAVFFALLGRERRAGVAGAMRRDGQNVGGAIGEPEAGAGQGNLHHIAGEVAGGMEHVLVGGGDAAAGGVVIGAEVGGDAAAARSGHQAGEGALATVI